MPALVETHGLTKRYGSARGIEEISLAVQRGETFGLLGPNGAGKTTLIRTLLGLLRPTAGSATLFGLDSRRDSVAVRARLGNLPGDFACDPRLTGRELLRFCSDVRGLPGLGSAEHLAERFHADLDRPLGSLSRGNRQKVGLIQAAFHEPELLMLDEPTSGLDPLMQEEFLALVEERHNAGTTVLMSSHDLDEVQRACDRVAIVREGRLVAVEAVAELRGRMIHRVRVVFADPGPAHAELVALPGVTGVERSGAELRCGVTGDLDSVVKALARHTIVDMELTEPTLEEVFLTYYGRQGPA